MIVRYALDTVVCNVACNMPSGLVHQTQHYFALELAEIGKPTASKNSKDQQISYNILRQCSIHRYKMRRHNCIAHTYANAYDHKKEVLR